MPGAEPFDLDGGPEAHAGVVLCHGFTGTPHSMRPWGEYLHAAGFTVRCPRLPGHGTRWRDMNVTRWEDWYGELERALDTVRARHDVVVAMGLSMGGTLTLRLAEERGDDLAGIVLVNASLATERRDAPLLAVASRFVGSLPGIASDIKKPGAAEVAYDRLPLRAAHSLSRLWQVTRADLGRITVPVRVYRSAEDHVVEPLSGRLLLEGVASDDVIETVLTDSYHVATLDNDAETIFAGSAEFTRQLVLARAGNRR
ncbi:MAG TPA: alpha/beta fold hydrolase [Mycobacteriales bacterium]|jgi:carboxylesterase